MICTLNDRPFFVVGAAALLAIGYLAQGCGDSGGGNRDAGDADVTADADDSPNDGGPDDGSEAPPGDGQVELDLGPEFGTVTGDTDFDSVNSGTPSAGVRCDDVTYTSQGLTIAGQVCVPVAAGDHPILIVNHGLGAYKQSHAPEFAALGYAVFESAYRGEAPSQGLKEYCAGEIYDVRRMIQIAKAQPNVDATRIGMIGYSHGGCVTMKTLLAETLADTTEFEAVVNVFGPADWARTYGHIAQLGSYCEFLPNLTPCPTLADLRRATGGVPAQAMDAYNDRSPLFYADLLSDVTAPLLIMHATGDSIVPFQPNCELADAMGAFSAWHIDGFGNVAAAACAGANLTWGNGTAPTSSYPAERTLFIYDTFNPLGHDESLGAGTNMQGRARAFLLNKFAP